VSRETVATTLYRIRNCCEIEIKFFKGRALDLGIFTSRVYISMRVVLQISELDTPRDTCQPQPQTKVILVLSLRHPCENSRWRSPFKNS